MEGVKCVKREEIRRREGKAVSTLYSGGSHALN